MTEGVQPDSGQRPDSISLVLPLLGDERGLQAAVDAYAQSLRELGVGWEIVLAARGPLLAGASEQVRVVDPAVKVCAAKRDGWGAAVRAGLDGSGGTVLCYTNWRRTRPATLAEMLRLAIASPGVVLRANRRTRDTRLQRLGSLLFNLECRLLLQVPAWDINGTPKIFPRAFDRLLALDRDDDLIDAEFALVCERSGYPVIEVPVDATLPPGVEDVRSPGYAAALALYAKVPGLARSAEARR